MPIYPETMTNKIGLIALAFALVGVAAAADGSDEAVLRHLNDDYVRAFVGSDVVRYATLLADDFHAVLADGRQIDKAEFLRQAAQPSGVADFRLQDVAVRPYGDTALVGGLVTYRHVDGSVVRTRYVDVYVRRLGQWQIVSVQFTRVAAPR